MAIAAPPEFPEDGDPQWGLKMKRVARWQRDNWAEVKAEIERITSYGAGAFDATSTSSVAVGLGAKSFTVETGKGFRPGQPVIIPRTSAPLTTYMAGLVASYDSVTGALSVEVTRKLGSGTYTDWTVTITSFASERAVGDVVTGTTLPTDGTYLELGTGAYLKSAYADLATLLGELADRPEAVKAWANNGSATAAILDIAYTGARFIGVGGAEIRDLGSDGNSFAAVTGHGFTAINTIATNGLTGGSNITMFYMNSGTVTGRSTDGGLTVGAGGLVPAGAFTASGYGHGQFVAMGNNLCATSPDGLTAHTARTFSGTIVPRTLRPLATTNSWIVAVSGGAVKRSTDNCSSFSSDIPTGLTSVTGVAVRGDEVILFGALNSLPAAAKSRDGGLTWRVTFNGYVGSGAATTMGGAVQIGGLAVATTGAPGSSALGLLVTADGESFVHVPSAAALGSSSSVIAAGNGRLVATNTSATNAIQRTPTPLISYSSTTQFAVPASAAPIGTRQWIKAAA